MFVLVACTSRIELGQERDSPGTSPGDTTSGGMIEGGSAVAEEAGWSHSGEAGGETSGAFTTGVGVPPESGKLDVLFVIDNSPGMSSTQLALADAVDDFFRELELGYSDFRVGVTTTDNGNPLCDTQGAEGQLLVRACHQHPELYPADSETDPFDVCQEACPLEDIPRVATSGVGDISIRSWIEYQTNGDGNLAMGTDPFDALACMMAVGVDGCALEQPLESMALALERVSQPGGLNYGFLREDAHLALVLVTSEDDCSYVDPAIFDPQGARTFWGDPMAAAPASDVCWNASTQCEASPRSCAAVDRTIDGSITDDSSTAVMQPVTRYPRVRERLVDETAFYGKQLFVFAVAGFGAGGEPAFGELGSDPEFEESFGTPPACGNGLVEAVPAVRLSASVGAYATGLVSICELTTDPGVVLPQLATTMLPFAD